jgi:hypothetical protein
MNEQAMNPHDLAGRKSEIEQLARETRMPLELVDEIYNIEHAKLDRIARIKTFVPVLTRRRVKARLRTQRAAS